MNDTPMLIDDATVIARLRSALDEVARTPAAGTGGADGHDDDGGFGPPPYRLRATSPFATGDRRRWLAAAAAIVVLVGATVWALTGRHPSDQQDPAATVPPTVLDTTSGTEGVPGPTSTIDPNDVASTVPASQPIGAEPTSALPTTTIEPVPAWFSITDPSLTAGPVTTTPASTDRSVVQSWTVTTASGGRGFLTVGVFASPFTLDGDFDTTPIDVAEGTAQLFVPLGTDGTSMTYGYQATWTRSDGSEWFFRSQGLTTDELAALVRQAVPGSGLPIVIPDPSTAVISTGVRTGAFVEQEYTGEGLNGEGTVLLRRVDDGTALDNIVGAANVVDVTIAGTAGWAALLDNGSIEAVWPTENGSWATVTVSAELARAADGIFASVQPADPSAPPS